MALWTALYPPTKTAPLCFHRCMSSCRHEDCVGRQIEPATCCSRLSHLAAVKPKKHTFKFCLISLLFQSSFTVMGPQKKWIGAHGFSDDALHYRPWIIDFYDPSARWQCCLGGINFKRMSCATKLGRKRSGKGNPSSHKNGCWNGDNGEPDAGLCRLSLDKDKYITQIRIVCAIYEVYL